MAYTTSQGFADGRSRTVAGINSRPDSNLNRRTRGRAEGYYATVFKRLLDVILVVLSLPVVLPLMAILWVITALDGGNVFYSQIRVGRNEKTFRCWKFRTMVPDADAALTRLIHTNEDIATEWARDQKLKNDPRVTRWGRILRGTSMDELPQLFNVLAGDMSLVGPRPFTEDQKDLYDAEDIEGAYYMVRPGISGLWQVKCRNHGSFSDRIAFDREYSKNISLVNDAKIILATFKVIFCATGK